MANKADAPIRVEVTCPNCGKTRIVTTQKRHIKATQGRLCRACATKLGRNTYLIRESLAKQVRHCLFCSKPFTPQSGNQRHCSSDCQKLNFNSKYYFGGKLKEATGFLNRQCVICGRLNVSKHAIHHAWGKETHNSPLVFLCSGCHNLLTRFWGRKFVSSPAAVERFISLALARKLRKEPPKVKVIFSYKKIPANQGKLI